jgi:hypothetical protein
MLQPVEVIHITQHDSEQISRHACLQMNPYPLTPIEPRPDRRHILHRLDPLHARIFRLDTRLHQRRMAQNDDSRRKDEPEKGRYGRREP